jgi:purine nucleosidase
LIDTDTGSDDAVALIMAMKYPGVSIEVITVVAGNVPVDQGVQNALYTIELCDQDIPVHRGLAAPMTRPLQTAQFIHGEDGMGDIGLPLSGRSPTSRNAIRVIIDIIHQFAGQLTLVALGPLTNIAVALRHDPTIATAVSECIIMGGTGRGRGNITPVGEFNFWADPEAAKVVFESGLPITMVGWDISRTYAVLDAADQAALRAIGTPLAHYSHDIQKAVQQFALTTTKLPGFDLPDPIAMAIALDPTVATEIAPRYVAIETSSDLCRGQSVVDHVNVLQQKPNTTLVLQADRPKFLNILHSSVSG